MNRREFLAASGLAATAAAAADASPREPNAQPAPREYYELRTLTFASAEAKARYAEFLKTVFIPAAKRAGASAVGAFGVADKPEDLSIYLLQSFPSLRVYATAENKLLEDAEFNAAGAAVNNLLAPDPPYTRAECSLMAAFKSWPKLKPPKEAAANEPRMFELRIYESHSRKANKKKIEMFDVGETDAFARSGMQPVFFGETLVGPQVPNLTYMVTYPSAEGRGPLWQKFLADPEMKRLFAVPEYANNLVVSKIRSVNLVPLAGSEI